MEKKIDMVKLFAAIYRSLHIYKGVAESMDKELKRQGFVAVDTPDGVRFAEIKQPQYTNDAPLGIDNKLNPIYPTELAESDESVRKEMLEYCNKRMNNEFAAITIHQIERWIPWLEKQGEQNLANSAQTCKNEQKPKGKVEQKFKVGDWIVKNDGNDCFSDGSYVLQIMGIYDEGYTLSNGNFLREPFSHTYRLWTIQDAKDGDVLVDNFPFIFKRIDHLQHSYAYCGISVDYGFRVESEADSGEWTWSQDIKPATKEQRDLLFQKMREAGYEWDAEKKELKKIEQKPAWSEEDEINRDLVYNALNQVYDMARNKKLSDWINNRILFIQNTWKPSDEQIKSLQESIGIVGELTPRGECLKELVEQLKKHL